ncbi:MAG: hypothetical protein KAS01_01785 [Candidatus Pacebacteria bacterium]|nr:hypothetical protein [Candidatus Paceibacterota bacterium]
MNRREAKNVIEEIMAGVDNDKIQSIMDGEMPEAEVVEEVNSWRKNELNKGSKILDEFAFASFLFKSNIEEGDCAMSEPFSTRLGAAERIEIGITTRLSDIRAMKIRSFVLAVKAENRLYSDMIWLLQFQTEHTEEDIDKAFGYERNKGFAFC